MNKFLSTTERNDLGPWAVFRDDFLDIFNRFSKELERPTALAAQDTFGPKIDVTDLGNFYRVYAEVPGMEEKDLNVSLRENNLVIEGEKKDESKNADKQKGLYHSEIRYGRFHRSIPFPEDVDPENVSASYRNGVLTIELAKLPEKHGKSVR